jgi:hypothetical protein
MIRLFGDAPTGAQDTDEIQTSVRIYSIPHFRLLSSAGFHRSKGRILRFGVSRNGLRVLYCVRKKAVGGGYGARTIPLAGGQIEKSGIAGIGALRFGGDLFGGHAASAGAFYGTPAGLLVLVTASIFAAAAWMEQPVRQFAEASAEAISVLRRSGYLLAGVYFAVAQCGAGGIVAMRGR